MKLDSYGFHLWVDAIHYNMIKISFSMRNFVFLYIAYHTAFPYSRWGLTSALKRRVKLNLSKWEKLLRMIPEIWFALLILVEICCSKFRFSSIVIPRSFSAVMTSKLPWNKSHLDLVGILIGAPYILMDENLVAIA